MSFSILEDSLRWSYPFIVELHNTFLSFPIMEESLCFFNVEVSSIAVLIFPCCGCEILKARKLLIKSLNIFLLGPDKDLAFVLVWLAFLFCGVKEFSSYFRWLKRLFFPLFSMTRTALWSAANTSTQFSF